MKLRRIGAPVSIGCDLPGAETAIRSLQANGIIFDDIIDVKTLPENKDEILHLNSMVDFLGRLKQSVMQCVAEGEFPLTFGGDHSLAIATIAAQPNKKRGILWIDAHGDCNTHESSVSKRIHGMPLAVVQGHGHPKLLEFVKDNIVDPHNIMLVGIRSLDEEEEKLMKQWGLRWFSQATIDKNGPDWTLREIEGFLTSQTEIHLSFDCDSIDPDLCPGVSTPVAGGLNPDLALAIIQQCFTSTHVSSMDIVEYNPLNDDGQTLSLVKRIDQWVDQWIKSY